MPASPLVHVAHECQLAALQALHPGPIKLRGREYHIGNIRQEGDLGFFADAHTSRTKLIAMQIPAEVIGRPGAESWTIMRLTGKGVIVANFAIWESKVLELA